MSNVSPFAPLRRCARCVKQSNPKPELRMFGAKSERDTISNLKSKISSFIFPELLRRSAHDLLKRPRKAVLVGIAHFLRYLLDGGFG